MFLGLSFSAGEYKKVSIGHQDIYEKGSNLFVHNQF